MSKLKRYKLKINPKNGSMVDFISQVESPAIERGFLKFSERERFTINEDKMELFGPVLIPDMPIYRRSEQMGEYEVVFTTETIKEIQMNFMKSGYQNNINVDHSEVMANSFVFESFISDDLIPNPKPFADLPLGTWFVRMKVEDKNMWQDIKDGKRTGFSIEGIFEYLVDEFEKDFLEKQKSDTTNIIETHDKISNEIMLKIKDVKDALRKAFIDFADEMTDSTESEFKKVASADYQIDSREVGQKVEVIAEDKSLVNAPDGSYEFEDGFKFTVKDGLIESIDGEVLQEEVKAEDAPVGDAPAEGTEVDDKSTDSKAEIDELKKDISELQTQIEEIKNLIAGVPTQESMTSVINEIKTDFKSVFEKFAQIPSEVSKVTKSNVVKDDTKAKFEAFVSSLRK